MTLPNSTDLAEQLAAVEDRLAIYTLIASHPPSADAAFAEYTRDAYLPDGVFDRGPDLEGAKGVGAIASFTVKPAHQEAIHLGGAHFGALPLIDLRGHHAIVTSYRQILHLDHEGFRVIFPITALPRDTAFTAHCEPVGTRGNQRSMDDPTPHTPAGRWIARTA